MQEWTDSVEGYSLEIPPGGAIYHKSVLVVPFDAGVFATFGESKSRWKSGDYTLLSVFFVKEPFSAESAQLWWEKHEIKFLSKKKYGPGYNKEIPEACIVVKRYEGYAFVCKRVEKQVLAYTVINIFKKNEDIFIMQSHLDWCDENIYFSDEKKD